VSRTGPTLDRTSFGWTAAAVVGALLPLSNSLPGWISAALLGLCALGIAYGWRRRILTPWVRLPLTLGCAAIVLNAYDFRFGRDTGAALLASMLALKLLETRRPRDARSVLSFSLFAIMAAFLQEQSPTTLLIAVLGVVLTLTALARVAEVDIDEGGPVAALAPRRRLGATGRLLLISAPLAIVGFFLFPRLSEPLWGLPGNVGEARTGLSDDMGPGDISLLYADDTPAFRVTFDGPAPPSEAMYWRGPVLSHFDGRRWTRSPITSSWPAGPVQPRGAELSYEVMMEPTDRRYLIVLDLPATVPADATIGFDRTVFTRRTLSQLRRYRASSHLDYVLEPTLRTGFRATNLDLPDGFNPRTRALIGEWTRADADPRRVIERALALFNREFTYTLSPRLLGRNSIDEFLFTTREGYCEHYASAFVVMMRMAGIPARVVTGYQGGESNAFGDYFLIRHSDAHAWAEVWLDGAGWVRIDPTSAVAPQRIQRGSDSIAGPEPIWTGMTRPLLQVSDWLRRSWNEVVLGFDASRQRSLLQPFGIPQASTPQLGLTLSIAVGLALLLTVGLLLRGAPDPRDRLQRAYARFVAVLARAGVSKSPHEGQLAFAARAAAQLPGCAETVLSLSRRYARRRYARVDTDPAADAALCDDLRRFRVPSSKRLPNRRSA
jgi:transglutaminase-like putative cysteine protease